MPLSHWPLLAPAIAVLWTLLPAAILTSAESGPWDTRARAFMDQHGVAPIEFKPGARLQRDLDEQWLKWAERTIVTPFAQRATRWPQQEKEVVDFVRQALRFRQTKTHPDPAVTPSTLLKRGEDLLKAKVDDPLVTMLTGFAETLASPGWPPPTGRFDKAAKHPRLKELPPTIRLMILSDLYEVKRDYNTAYHMHEEQVNAAMECVEDPATFGPDDDEIMARMLVFLFYDSFFRPYEAKVKAVCDVPHLPEWVYHYFQGRWEYAKALKLRDQGGTSVPGSEGWIEVQSRFSKARDFLNKAWQLHPERADAPMTMIFLINAGGGGKEDSARQWFDRAIAAQFDYIYAYRGLLYASGPSHDGSADKVKAFALACALTRRHDTEVPAYIYEIMRRLTSLHGTWKTPYRDELLSQALYDVGAGRIADPARAWDRPRLQYDLAIRLWASGDFARAGEAFKKLTAPFPSRSRSLVAAFEARESIVRGECAIHAAGKYPAWTAAEALYLSGDLDKAGPAYADIASSLGEDVPHVLAGRIAAVKSEKALAAGDWVRMNVTPALEDWTIHTGQWEGASDGVLVNRGEGESAFILYNPRIGANLEIRGEYEVPSPAKRNEGLGVVVGYGRAGTANADFLLCLQRQIKDYCETSILRQFYLTDEPFRNIGPPVPKSTFVIRYEDGRIDYTLNDKVALKGHTPLQRGKPVSPIFKDGRVGFGNSIFLNNQLTRILKAEVRRLP